MKKIDASLIPVQCECGEFKAVEFGTKDTICSNCHHGIKMTWKDVDPEQEGLKHGDYYEVSYYVPLGGATSFEEASAFEDARETSFNISDVKFKFDSIFENIMSDDEKSSDEKIAAVEQASKDMVSLIQNPEESKSLAERLKNLIGLGNKFVEKPLHRETFFTIMKDIRGELRWLAIFTNQFEDREKEIFSEAAHKEYEQWVDDNQRYPVLRIWHMPGADIGLADNITYVDGFMLATGTFYETSLDVAEKLAARDDVALSHGYLYRPKDLSDGGVFSSYRTFEISVLPQKHAANSWTAFTMESLQKEVTMGIDTKKRPFFVDLLGEERVKALEDTLPKLNKDLEEAGVAWKDLQEVLASDTDINSNGNSESEEENESSGDGKTSEEEEDSGDSEKTKQEPVPVGVAIDDKALEGLKAVLEPMTKAISEIQGEIVELKKTDDEKISSRMQQANITNGKRPTESEDNVMKDEKTKDLDKPDENQEVGGQTAAAREIVDELLLGKKRSVTI